MPKIVDNYILERKIGSGQFGEVYKGYNRNTNQDIAVKVVKRELLKGKFHELLENEIKVLRTCNNENIMKLYDLKKTANNFYMILEYCNEGDLMGLLKQRKHLTEEEAVDYLIQILNGFKTLVKSKIMHRDFKLANILKHNGSIKIADFGFAKLLSNDNYTSTMLGSPLNMAPEILNGEDYNNKADIWSIGTVFYEILFGKPPFTAGNMIDLLKNIKTKPIEFNKNINNISPIAEDAIRRMLVVDPNKRIEWNDLFNHKINFYQEEEMKKELNETFKDMNLSLSMSKFYIKNNKVISHPTDIQKKQELNDFVTEMAKKTVKQDQQQIQQQQQQNEYEYKGAFVKRQTERSNSNMDQIQNQQENEEQKVDNNESPIKQQNTLEELSQQETQREIQIRVTKRNSNRILHERNIYVFLASVAEDAMNLQLNLSEIVGFLLVKQLITFIENLKSALQAKINIFGLDMWENYVYSKDFQDILMYISKEYDVFRVYFEQLYDRIVNNIKLNRKLVDNELLSAINQDFNQNIDKVFSRVLIDYSRELLGNIVRKQNFMAQDELRHQWVHIDRILDCLRLDMVFQFEDKRGNQFNFKSYYDEANRYELDSLVKKVEFKLVEMKI